MKKVNFIVFCIVFCLNILPVFSQVNTSVNQPNGSWIPLIKGDRFDPNDDQQSVADTDFVGNATYALLETQKETINFSDGITDDVYFFRVRMGQSNPSTSFYLGIDVSGDLVADIFVEANVKTKTPFVSFHKRDYAKTGLSPSQTSWLNGSQNDEEILNDRNANITSYSAGTDIDGGNSGTDYWIAFGFTEESIKNYAFNNFGLAIDGDAAIALYGFTSTSQTSNGDVAGVNDKEPGVLDKTWVELGVVINGTLNNIVSGEILTPTVNFLTTTETTTTITGTWGGDMLGDDSLSITVNGKTYTEEISINDTKWSLVISSPELTAGTYDVVATTTRSSNNASTSDITSAELVIIPTETSNESTTVTSANDGGLESNGDLANLIAKRNFNRIKNNHSTNIKKYQAKFIASKTSSSKGTGELDLSSYFPETLMFGTESSTSSSATDLLNITNAEKIVGVDYYNSNSERIAASLATQTTGKIYDHSKVICDRLNNSILVDSWVFNVKGHQIILLEIKRANGLTEFSLNFSIEMLEAENKLHSYWSIEQYPTGNYLNFQIWGSSIDQISFIANYILTKIAEPLPLKSESMLDFDRVPTVFVQKGSYKNGKLYLTIKNKANNTVLNIEGNKRETEQSNATLTSKNISLTGQIVEEIVVETGSLFDVGFSVKGNESNLVDALYLADGPWGVDYLTEEVENLEFNIETQELDLDSDKYQIERKSKVNGKIKGTVNVFRNLLAGDLSLDVNEYGVLEFTISNNLPVEVILVTENLSDWNNRLRIKLDANNTLKKYKIPFKDFLNGEGVSEKIQKIKSIVFSTQGDYTQYNDFSLELSEVAFLLDADQDGVTNDIDQCSNTPYGAEINSSGCFMLPSNNFKVMALGESCPDTKNGQITLLAEKDYSYETTINSKKYNFKSEGITISDLSPGVYNFCVNVVEGLDENEAVKQCFSITIDQAQTFSAKSSISSKTVSIEIAQGTAPYTIFVNGTNVLETMSNSFDIDVVHGDKVEVITAKICEGLFEKTIALDGYIKAFPNPTVGNFEINVPQSLKSVNVELYNMNSQLISSNSYSAIYGKIQLNLIGKPNGIYMAKINLEKPIVLKIVKQ